MDKETAERLARLETKMEVVDKERESWNQLIKRIVAQSAMWLVSMAFVGAIFGWKLPASIRQSIADWAAK